MALRRKQGLCYNCDEPYVRGHKCARLFFLEASDYIVEDPDDGDAAQEVQATEPPPFDAKAPMIFLSAITGIRTEETMQLRVHIGQHEFTTLLDSGSMHNFISAGAAQRVGLIFSHSAGAHVVVVNGDRVACRGLAHDVGVQIRAEDFKVDCYSIPLDCYDMVLGIAWLRTLGPILWDFDALWMAFTRHGRRVLWKGLGAPRSSAQCAGRIHAGHLYTAKGTEGALLERLLDAYDDVFAAPTGLPPARPCDHRIHLKPTTDPVAVRPYRYPTPERRTGEAV